MNLRNLCPSIFRIFFFCFATVIFFASDIGLSLAVRILSNKEKRISYVKGAEAAKASPSNIIVAKSNSKSRGAAIDVNTKRGAKIKKKIAKVAKVEMIAKVKKTRTIDKGKRIGVMAAKPDEKSIKHIKSKRDMGSAKKIIKFASIKLSQNTGKIVAKRSKPKKRSIKIATISANTRSKRVANISVLPSAKANHSVYSAFHEPTLQKIGMQQRGSRLRSLKNKGIARVKSLATRKIAEAKSRNNGVTRGYKGADLRNDLMQSRVFLINYNNKSNKNNIPHELHSTLNLLLSRHSDARNIKIAYQQRVRSKPSLIYMGFKERERIVSIYRYQLSDGTSYFLYRNGANAGANTTNMQISMPLRNIDITSGYGIRIHPLLGYRKMHEGIDCRAPIGTPVFALKSGRAKFVGRAGGYGRSIEIQHGGGDSTFYAHLHQTSIRAGQYVTQGQMIGKVGASGRTSGAHLHLEYRKNGRPIDPMKILRIPYTALTPKQMRTFADQRNVIEATIQNPKITSFIS